MQPRDGFAQFDLDQTGAGDDTDSIRERQRRRRDAARVQADMEAILAVPPEEEEEPETAPPGPARAKVFVVFRGAAWEDPDGELRESDSIAEVHGTEDGARRAVARLKRDDGDRMDAWYQPYSVQE
ncbi:MAG: hypothetical protein HY332_03815 [Chloroflexi bacterium]|nr:hypothetical protein [Chloroflexota bacterium]